MEKATIKDIARELNLSVATVYRAFNNTGRIKESTKQRVLQKAEELQYRTNITARQFAQKNKLRFLFVIPSRPKYYWDDIEEGVQLASRELGEFGLEIIVHTVEMSSFASVRHEDIIETMEQHGINGLLVTRGRIRSFEKLLAYCKERGVCVGIYNDGPEYRDSLFFYGPSNEKAGGLASELISKLIRGRGEIAVTGYGPDLPTFSPRIKGFMNYLDQYCPDITTTDISLYNKGEEDAQLKKLMGEHPNLSAIYIMDANGAGVFGQLLKQAGRKDLVLVGHEASPLAREMLMEGYVTALLCDKKVCQGYYPIKMLFDYMSAGIMPAKSCIYTDTNIVIRENLASLHEHLYGCGFK